jgi:hypothetical protein
MKTKTILFLLIIVLALSSCTRDRQGRTVVSGMITGIPGSPVKFFELGPEHTVKLDSLALDADGKFVIKLDSGETGLYLLRTTRPTPLVLELSPGESVWISGPGLNFPEDIIIKGSAASIDLLDFFKASTVNSKKFDSLEHLLVSSQDEPGFAKLSGELDESLKPVWDKQKDLEINYIRKHPNSLTSLLVLNHGLGVSPLLTYRDDSVYFLKLDSSLGKAFPGNKHVVFHHKRIIQARAIEAIKKTR